MIRIKVKIIGIKPILFHRFNIESIRNMSKIRTGSAGNDPEEWKTSFFHNDGKLYIPGFYIFSALKSGSFFTKVGRGSIQNTWISACNVEDEIIYLNRKIFPDWEGMTLENLLTDSSQPVYVDVRMVSNPNTKGKNIRYRLACSPGWEANFSLLVDDTLVSFQQAKKIISDTGKLKGLCDGITLGYGRFVVDSIESEKLDEN